MKNGIKDIPAKIRDEYDGLGHHKLTNEQMELQEVIRLSFNEMRLEGFRPVTTFEISWVRKDIEKYLEKKGIEITTVSPVGELVTDREKVQFIADKMLEELRKMRVAAGGKELSRDWYDMERKARELLNIFGNSIDGGDKAKNDPRPLVRIMGLFMDAMFRFGKWGK